VSAKKIYVEDQIGVGVFVGRKKGGVVTIRIVHAKAENVPMEHEVPIVRLKVPHELFFGGAPGSASMEITV
jgi:hypothetical protein